MQSYRRSSIWVIAKDIAPEVLRRGGMGSIWQLHLAAATAHREGQRRAAENLIEIADAVEQAWRQTTRSSTAET